MLTWPNWRPETIFLLVTVTNSSSIIDEHDVGRISIVGECVTLFYLLLVGKTNSCLHLAKSNRDKKENLSLCPEECNNIGIVIFVTTLIVTVVHFTLATSVYLYLNKLKRISHHKSFPPNLMGNLNSMTPSSSSSISSLGCGGEDSFNYGSEAMVHADAAAAYTSGLAFSPSTIDVSPSGAPFHLNKELQSADQQQQQWLAMQNATYHRRNSSIRSTFNRDNIFFGPREQRFFGIKNYSFGPVHGSSQAK